MAMPNAQPSSHRRNLGLLSSCGFRHVAWSPFLWILHRYIIFAMVGKIWKLIFLIQTSPSPWVNCQNIDSPLTPKALEQNSSIKPIQSLLTIQTQFKDRHASVIHYDDAIMSAIASQITSLATVYSTVYLNADQRKHSRSVSLPSCGEFTGDRWIPRTMASNAENVSIWWRHHVIWG